MKQKLKNFIKQFVKIELQESTDSYGHYPFQLLVEMNDGKIEFNALALGGQVKHVYQRVKEYHHQEPNHIFLSLDFPKGGDIETDFIVVFSIIDNDVWAFAIPYNPITGKQYDVIKKSDHLDSIIDQFKNYVL